MEGLTLPDASHVAFADETHYNVGRFRGLACVSGPRSAADAFSASVSSLLAESNVRELAWKELKTARARFAAEKVLNSLVAQATSRSIRVDVLVWDIEDSRHSIQGRDDIKNLERMYHHLFHDVLRQRWPDDATWALRPDENQALDWVTLADVLQTKSLTGVPQESSLFRRLGKTYSLLDLTPVDSADEPLVQVADVLGGMAVFSRTSYDLYTTWVESASHQQSLLEDSVPVVKYTNAEATRFQVMKKFNTACKAARLGVSLATKQCFWTPRPENPINFWWWEPQSPSDKAPTRSSS